MKELSIEEKAKEMFIKALERVEEQNAKGYKLTDCDKNSWWEDFKAYTSCTIEQKPIEGYNIIGIGSKNAQGKLGEMIKNLKPVNEILEQNLANKVEPKFKVGDWVVNNNGKPRPFQVIARSWPDSKIKEAESDLESFINTATLDKQFHLWTIEDAKDGDVLLSPSTPEGDKECPFIFKEIDESGIVRFHAALLQSENFKIADGITNVMGYANASYHIPATKEQRKLLFSTMHEARYEWDAEKKELKKLSNIERQPHWKPTEAQIKALEWQVNNTCTSSWQYASTKELLEQLKTL